MPMRAHEPAGDRFIEAIRDATRFDHALREAARFAGSLGRSPARRTHAHHAASLVVETEADCELAIAAMMHDISEYAVDDKVVNAVRARFGERVARVVAWCGENSTHPMPPFRDLDEVRVAELLCATRDVLVVAAADTLSAVESLTADLAVGPVDAVASDVSAETMRWFLYEVDVAMRDRLPGHVLTARLSRAIAGVHPLLRRTPHSAAS